MSINISNPNSNSMSNNTYKVFEWSNQNPVDYDTKSKEEKFKEQLTGIKENPVRDIEYLNNYINRFRSGPKVDIKKGCFYYPTLFEGRKCFFRTPEMSSLFEVYEYKVKYEQAPKYCIHLSIDDSNEKIKNMHTFLDYMDMFAFQHITQLDHLKNNQGIYNKDPNYVETEVNERFKYKFVSGLRSNYKDITKPLTLQIKVDHIGGKTNIYFAEINKPYILINDIKELSKRIAHNMKVSCVVEVSNVWFSDYKFGISYKCVAISVCPPAQF